MKKWLSIGLLVSYVLANDPISGLCSVELDTAKEKLEEAQVFQESSATLDEARAYYGPQAYEYFDALKKMVQANKNYAQAVMKMCKGVKK